MAKLAPVSKITETVFRSAEKCRRSSRILTLEEKFQIRLE